MTSFMTARRAATLLTATTLGATLVAARPATPVPHVERNPVAARPVPRAEGLTFTYSLKSASTDKKTREAMDRVATVRIQDGNVRMDFTLGTPMPGQKNGYMLVLGEAKQFAIVSDKDKSVLIMDASTMGGGLGAISNNPLLKMTMKDASFSYQDLGAGDKILGYATRHVRTINASTMEMKVIGMTRKSSNADTADQWIARDIGLDPSSLLAWSKAFGSGLKETNPELAAQMAKYQQEYGRTGIVLRSMTHTSHTNDKGKVETDTLTMEVTDLKKGAIDPALFKYPSDYKVTDMSQMMNGMKASMDSAKEADAQKKKKGGI